MAVMAIGISEDTDDSFDCMPRFYKPQFKHDQAAVIREVPTK